MDILNFNPGKDFHMGITFNGTSLIFTQTLTGKTGKETFTVEENIDQGIDVIVDGLIAKHPTWTFLKAGAGFVEAALGLIK